MNDFTKEELEIIYLDMTIYAKNATPLNESMNDFTKEELEDILSWGNVYCDFGASFVYEVHKPLIDKIQSMIDTYCEHLFIFTLNDSSVHCHKCKKKLNDNK